LLVRLSSDLSSMLISYPLGHFTYKCMKNIRVLQNFNCLSFSES